MLSMKKKELIETSNIRMFETRQEENLKKNYLAEKQDCKDFRFHITSAILHGVK